MITFNRKYFASLLKNRGDKSDENDSKSTSQIGSDKLKISPKKKIKARRKILKSMNYCFFICFNNILLYINSKTWYLVESKIKECLPKQIEETENSSPVWTFLKFYFEC